MFLFKLFFFPAIVQIWDAAPQRPNNVVIFADDIGFANIGGFGSDIETLKWLRIVLPLFDGHPLRPHRGQLHGPNFCDRYHLTLERAVITPPLSSDTRTDPSVLHRSSQ